MYYNLISLSIADCPDRILIDKKHLGDLTESLSDYLGLQPVKPLAITTVTSSENADEDGLAAFVLAGNGYLTLRSWPGSPERSLSLNLGTREETETTRLLSWLETHFQVEKSHILLKLATQGVTLSRATGKEMQSGT